MTPRRAVAAAAALTLLCAVIGMTRAASMSWLTDDAFISFRYALNLVEGQGLVFNQGERVEGYTNFLWTIWCALALRLGIDPARWAVGWGIALYGASIVALGWRHLTTRRALGVTTFTLPAAALIAALHEEWISYATGGLETACFTFLALLGYLVVTRPEPGHGRLAAAGVILAACCLTRPDGVIFAGLAGIFVLTLPRSGRSRWLAAAVYAAGFLAIWLPFVLWRMSYYGDFFPNTYYAKSAYLTWYDQGWHYLRLFFVKYWVLALALPLAGLALPRLDRTTGRQGALAVAFALAYALYVTRVGGDFMFGRLLVPVVPFLALLADLALLALLGRRPTVHAAAVAAFAVALLVTPTPIAGRGMVHGIAVEPRHYTEEVAERTDRAAEVLRRYFDGLDVTVAFIGAEARLIYGARVARAIECETGLTDRTIARQTLEQRGRPGHEKHASLDYLLGEGRANFAFQRYAMQITQADERISEHLIHFDDVTGFVLRWDAPLLAELRRRGAVLEDFPQRLDRILHGLDELPPEERRRTYEKVRRFYFDHVDDPVRQAAFEEALAR